jgi:predicted lipoprotein
MKAIPSRGGRRIVLALAVVGAVVAALRPWTVVPIQTTAAPAFDPEKYVGSIWESRVLPAADRAAVDVRTVGQGSSGGAAADGRPLRAIFVKGTATVTEVDRKSLVGLARLTSGPPAAIQIGPVLRGTALRDALDFIQFADFVNQLEFAAVANALNARVITDVIGPLSLDDLAGREVTFVGAVALPAAPTLEIVPVRLRISGGPK